jgi:hypothetical protein
MSLPLHRAFAGCAITSFLLINSAAAHDTFLVADKWSASRGEILSLRLISGGNFPQPDIGPDPARIVASAARLAGIISPLNVGEHGEDALQLTTSAHSGGLLVAALTLGPRDIDLSPESVAHYFEEIRPSAAVVNAWEAGGRGEFLETYTKHAKLMACVTPCTIDEAALAPLGAALEFVPAPSPQQDQARFRLLALGEPMAGQPVTYWTGDGRHRAMRTDAEGEVTVPLDVPGPAMLTTVDLRLPPQAGARFQSDFATLTFLAGQ